MEQQAYLRRNAAALRGILSDLKRNEEVAARELGIADEVLEDALAGRSTLPAEVIDKATRIWPVNERDFYPIHDDAETGVLIMHANESIGSSRVLQRAGNDYYEYRDTAMSRVAMLRPEWIKMLHPVEDNDPYNNTVQWNNGHFLFQFTYFVGPVNYYYEWQGRRFCHPMETGDSVFGLPWAAHSFASRSKTEPALILALTFGGRLLGDAQHELSVLGADAAAKLVVPLDDRMQAQAAMLRATMRDAGIAHGHLASVSGLDAARLDGILDGSVEPSASELSSLATALRVPLRELMPGHVDTENGVRIVPGRSAPSWTWPNADSPSYRVKQLAGSVVTPNTRSLEIEVLRGPADPDVEPFDVSLHQYGYNVGQSPVLMSWWDDGRMHEAVIAPEDSFYVKPFVRHSFRRVDSAEPAVPPKVLLLRVGGKLAGDVAMEASAIGAAGLRRLTSETSLWYDPAGRN